MLRAESVTIFEPKVVRIFARNTIMRKFAKLCKAIFSTHYIFFNQILGILLLSNHMSHDLGAVTIFRFLELGLRLGLGLDWG